MILAHSGASSLHLCRVRPVLSNHRIVGKPLHTARQLLPVLSARRRFGAPVLRDRGPDRPAGHGKAEGLELEGRRPAVRLTFVIVGGCRGPGTTSGTPTSADRPRRSIPGRASAVGWTFEPLGTGSGLFANEGFRVGRRSSGTGHGPRPGGWRGPWRLLVGWVLPWGCRRPAGWVAGAWELRTQQVGGQSEELTGLSPFGSRWTRRSPRRADELSRARQATRRRPVQ
jgi:hypothetical protein